MSGAGQARGTLEHAGQILARDFGEFIVSKQKMKKAEGICLVREKREAGCQTLGFTARPFVLCGLPIRRPPAGQLLFERRNGHFTLQITGHPQFGLPFGQDRLVPIFLATLAVRQQSQVVRFDSAAELLDTFGLAKGGKEYRRLVAAFERIFYGCLGNHEIVAECEALATQLAARRGMRFLRSQSATLRFGQSKLNIAGVDYQRLGSPYLAAAARMVRPGELNLLVSHSPDVFPVAVKQNWDVVLSGHTHGGQITLEHVNSRLNRARFYTPYTYGKYTQNNASLFVTSGLGTVGVPARLGTNPEIVSLRLTSRA